MDKISNIIRERNKKSTGQNCLRFMFSDGQKAILRKVLVNGDVQNWDVQKSNPAANKENV